MCRLRELFPPKPLLHVNDLAQRPARRACESSARERREMLAGTKMINTHQERAHIHMNDCSSVSSVFYINTFFFTKHMRSIQVICLSLVSWSWLIEFQAVIRIPF